MRAVRFHTAGGPDTLAIEEHDDPVVGPGQVLIDITGAGLNRADALQRRGRYNLPAGATDIFGLEVSGTVGGLGTGSTRFAVGDPVVALLASGGYAEKVAVDEGHVLPAPEGMNLLESAGVPEVAATLVSNICMTGRFEHGETVLIHGASGGIGSFGIQLVTALGGRVAVTASTDAKLAHASKLGADILIDYTTEDFSEKMIAAGGADIILDTVAGSYLDRNLVALNDFGRIITVGMQGGTTAELDFSMLMKKKATITGTLLRDRSSAQKTAIMSETQHLVWPLLASASIRPVTDRVFPLTQVAAAHHYFDSHAHIGKVLLDCRN